MENISAPPPPKLPDGFAESLRTQPLRGRKEALEKNA
jgi:hypothetical protein